MHITIIEEKHVMGRDPETGKFAERTEVREVPFETHPNELVRSVIDRYVKTLEKPPESASWLLDRGERVPAEKTMGDYLKATPDARFSVQL